MEKDTLEAFGQLAAVTIVAIGSGAALLRQLWKGRRNLREESQTINRLKEELKRLDEWADEEISRYSSRADKAEARADTFAEQRNRAYEQFAATREDLGRLSTQIDALTRRNSEQEQRIQELTASNHALHEQNRKLMEQNQELAKKVDQLLARFQGAT